MAFFKRVFVSTVGMTVVGSTVLAYDVQRNIVYPCQTFSDAVKQYITIRGARMLGNLYRVR
jgi:hypothetical protein